EIICRGDREGFQTVFDRAVHRLCIEDRKAGSGWSLSRRRVSFGMKIGVLVGSEDAPLVVDDRTTDRAAKAIVVEARRMVERTVSDGSLSKVVVRIEIAVLRIPFARTVPLVGATLGDD